MAILCITKPVVQCIHTYGTFNYAFMLDPDMSDCLFTNVTTLQTRQIENTAFQVKQAFGKTAVISLKIVRFSIRNHRWKAKTLLYPKFATIKCSRMSQSISTLINGMAAHPEYQCDFVKMWLSSPDHTQKMAFLYVIPSPQEMETCY